MERRVSRTEPVMRRGGSDQVIDGQFVVAPRDFDAHSPFLMLDEAWFKKPGGFEEHPHRGFQTVTLVLEGALEHRDHTGGRGVLSAGDAQWVVAGRGVLHSELPRDEEVVHTLQLWLNLPRAQKLMLPRYVDQPLARTPVRSVDGVDVRVYAGRSGEVRHPHGSAWPLVFLDLAMKAGSSTRECVPSNFRAFLYVLDGTASVADGVPVRKANTAWFDPSSSSADEDDTLLIHAETDVRAVLFASPPIDEPVVAYGPFVMNTREEIRQAIIDFQSGNFCIRARGARTRAAKKNESSAPTQYGASPQIS
jgi:redox-sensitive bicupin YhaK (pirin superfamily)